MLLRYHTYAMRAYFFSEFVDCCRGIITRLNKQSPSSHFCLDLIGSFQFDQQWEELKICRDRCRTSINQAPIFRPRAIATEEPACKLMETCRFWSLLTNGMREPGFEQPAPGISPWFTGFPYKGPVTLCSRFRATCPSTPLPDKLHQTLWNSF